MKTIIKTRTDVRRGPFILALILISNLILSLMSCQKETLLSENQSTTTSVQGIGTTTPQSISGSLAVDLTGLIIKIQGMSLNNSDANALVSKINSAIASIKKGNLNSLIGQLNALTIQVNDFIESGLITSEQGQTLLDVAGYVSASANGSPVIGSGLIEFYPFNGNTNDGSGNGKTGIPTNVAFTTDRNGSLNSAASFDNNGFIKVPGIGQANGSFSISLWYKTSLGGTVLSTDNIFMGADNLYNQFIASWGISIGNYGAAGNPVYFDNTWHHVAITHDVSEARIITYFDGIVQHDRPESGYFLGNIEDILIGAVTKQYNVSFPYISQYFTGSIDDIYFFNRAITSSEVEKLYYYPH